ncbi:MAG: hypothetical protein IPL22_07975 [Bacteroidetes bacterium]|nr:hypothetical protein [Bacteroidota bacterium]
MERILRFFSGWFCRHQFFGSGTAVLYFFPVKKLVRATITSFHLACLFKSRDTHIHDPAANRLFRTLMV